MRKPKDALTGGEIERLYPEHWIVLSPCKHDRLHPLVWGVVNSVHESTESLGAASQSFRSGGNGYAVHVTWRPGEDFRMVA